MAKVSYGRVAGRAAILVAAGAAGSAIYQGVKSLFTGGKKKVNKKDSTKEGKKKKKKTKKVESKAKSKGKGKKSKSGRKAA